ncbi:MAG: cupredoxin domain-containing protein [Thermomicrobiales bacterium]
MIQRVLTAALILLALAGAVVGHQATANSGGPLVVVSDEDDGECEDGDNSGSGSSNSGSGGGDECEDEDDDSGRGRGRGRGLGGDDDEGDEAVPPAAGADAPAADEVVVRIVDRGFSPANVTVAPGQTVTFVNEDDDEHTATGNQFDTGTIPPGNSATVTFDAAGAFDFFCLFHPEMQGRVSVEGDAAATPAASPAATPAGTPSASPAVAAAMTVQIQIQIQIRDFAFDPLALEISVGTTVNWTNNDAAAHAGTADGGAFDTGRLDEGQSGSVTFDEPGTFAYHCDFHPEMVGTIVVR